MPPSEARLLASLSASVSRATRDGDAAADPEAVAAVKAACRASDAAAGEAARLLVKRLEARAAQVGREGEVGGRTIIHSTHFLVSQPSFSSPPPPFSPAATP